MHTGRLADVVTLLVVQDASLSVWRRQAGQLSYSLLAMHKLVPPPSRVSNNAVVNILCLAASVWLCCNTDPSRSTQVSSMGHTTTSFDPLPSGGGKGGLTHTGAKGPDGGRAAPKELSSTGAAQTATSQAASQSNEAHADADVTDALTKLNLQPHANDAKQQPVSDYGGKECQRKDLESLLVMTVSDDGHVWQWNVPLHGFPPPQSPAAPGGASAAAPPASALPKPALLGLLHTLPHSVTTFSVCPVPVGAAWAGNSNQPSSQSGEGGDAVAVLAAVTSAGNVELITLQRGSLTPLSSAISVSLGMTSSDTYFSTQQ